MYQKLAGRYGTSGFSMGGGGTTYAATDDPTLLSNVAIMAWGPVSGLTVPSLFICGDADTLAGCALGMGSAAYAGIDRSVPKMIVTLNSVHYGQPSADGGKSGQYGLAFQKLFLENDQRWRPLLVAAPNDDSTIKQVTFTGCCEASRRRPQSAASVRRVIAETRAPRLRCGTAS